jgi:hypothetical protein
MKLTSMQFDGGGDTLPANPPKPLAPTPLAAKESGSIGATSMASQMAAASTPAKPKNSEYRGNAGGTAAKAKTPVDKSKYDRSIKIPQATVDAVKNDGRGNMGTAAANKVAYGSPGYNGSTFSPNAPVSAEYKEATKRVYPNAKATSPGASSGATNPKQPGPKATPKASPKIYGGAAAEKYKAEEKNAKNKSAFPSILPTPSKPTTKAKPNSAATMPPLMTPSTTKPKAAAATPAKIKVSQATVDAVKKAGKEKSIGATQYKGVSPEYKEAVRRIYQSPAKPKAKTKSGGGGGGKASSAVK